ncbi:LLM class flavin-dependent oxidoreductase [Microbacterium sp.]|uniref:LLM class flavin-dependent oxidoreductase n=1 Tax=Microbacterium sp. TaxID=51671 RepID=UPI0028116662|nr:LLM class flavin-dependent oxidoreductase [Microbacterium sp.]
MNDSTTQERSSRAPVFGTAPFALSVLDGGLTGIGHSAQQSLEEVVRAARLADDRGYRRFWMSEHHAMPGATIASPQLMIARLIGETRRIRLGAGGVMLPNHVPLIVAEQFGMLEALAPGRIDLGVGRAPGTDPATAAALRRPSASDDFAAQVDELLAFLGDEFPAGHRYHGVHAVPGPWQDVQNEVPRATQGANVWILGSSPYSALVAARLGRPYAFALQFGSADVLNAMSLYRQHFRRSAVLEQPYALVSVGVVADHDEREARRQASTTAMAMMRMFQREPFAYPSPDDVEAFPASSHQRAFLDEWTDRTIHGSPAHVAAQLEELQTLTGADELMLVVGSHSLASRSRTIRLMADHYQAGEQT